MKKSRKKILLSSIAMLLVALIALGSATFAWFSLNKSVKADGMTVKAASSKGLKISIDNGGSWAASKTFQAFDEEQILTPVSVDYSTTTGEADAQTTAYNAKLNGTPYYPDTVNGDDGAIWAPGSTAISGWRSTSFPNDVPSQSNTEAKTANGYFMAYEVGVKAEGLATGEEFGGITAQISMTNTTGRPQITDFARVALVQQAGAGQALASDTLKAVIGDDTAPNAISSISPVAKDVQKLEANGDSISLPNITATETWYTLYIWFEGQDAECLNDHMAAEGTVSITFTSTTGIVTV